MTQRKVIGIVGWIGSGKDTAAEYIVNAYGYKRDSFASSLKDTLSTVFGWNRDALEGRTAESRKWRDTVDQWWATRLQMPDLTPRKMMQCWGTHICREHFHSDIWTAGLERRIANTQSNVVVSDCRFPNEVAAIQNAGGKIIWVRGATLPNWYGLAVLAAIGCTKSQNDLDMLNVHASEYMWVGTSIDHTVYNTGTLSDLYSALDKIGC